MASATKVYWRLQILSLLVWETFSGVLDCRFLASEGQRALRLISVLGEAVV